MDRNQRRPVKWNGPSDLAPTRIPRLVELLAVGLARYLEAEGMAPREVDFDRQKRVNQRSDDIMTSEALPYVDQPTPRTP
jgi:hypothetical protein